MQTHIIDRLADWSAIFGTLAVVLLLGMGWGNLRDAATAGSLWWLIALLVAVAVAASALVFRLIISPIVGNQLRGLADVAEAIASGDLTQAPDAANAGGQLGRLGRAMVDMTATLRQLATLIRENASATSTRAAEITASTEHMAQAASGIAETASTLSHESAQMAETIRALNADAARLAALAAGVSGGAADGLARNNRLKTLATENAGLLDESARRLDELATDVQEGARATEALAQASDEIRAFVALVQKIARQSKLLALNAAMEAARAGEHGEGFTVVANEVRRLAQGTAEAAEKTDQLMKALIAQMETAGATGLRARGAVEAVRGATARGRQAFTQVERAVADGEQWVSAMASSAGAGQSLAKEITEKLSSLSQGTQAFADSMQDVAAASEEQSASTEEIAAVANSLVAAAEGVAGTANRFRTQS
ncbi:methyl-accepting chemotaxis protein [Pseudogemmatithrix spongiicola]|uniref:Methyl-accepting chemotaxis protein n=1 Tax=Pseudogemmatithrix spongiicola TaxID=3062599 RepID=A0AA49JS95_9BACT|nr:methyl-accepting chemotaxis protein [Gemmatimonadaceae bacterium 'strain 138']WKW13959.1 methyl-accepting chemotaxis protein [Gemmatimonadaceae bacterium 'strain 318']